MNEAYINTVVKNSLDWGQKIPDPTGMTALTASARCFDGFGIINNTPVYWESKFSQKLQAFNLQRLEFHQVEALATVNKLLPNAFVWVIYGVHVGRGDTRLYIFDWNFIAPRYKEKKNILKKDLEKLPYNSIHNNLAKLLYIIKEEVCDDV